jgi:hypothetical protein
LRLLCRSYEPAKPVTPLHHNCRRSNHNHKEIKKNYHDPKSARPATSSFVTQVHAFINSRALSQSQGQTLINAANAIRTNLGC